MCNIRTFLVGTGSRCRLPSLDLDPLPHYSTGTFLVQTIIMNTLSDATPAHRDHIIYSIDTVLYGSKQAIRLISGCDATPFSAPSMNYTVKWDVGRHHGINF
jgi:hypothetical protein